LISRLPGRLVGSGAAAGGRLLRDDQNSTDPHNHQSFMISQATRYSGEFARQRCSLARRP